MKKKFKLIIIITFSGLLACETYKTRISDEAVKIIKKMTLSQKIGQLLIVGVPERKFTDSTASIIDSYTPGGVILFGYNLGKPEEIKKYIGEMQRRAVNRFNIPMFISIDQEGGRVKRITHGITQFPGNMAFGVADNESLTYDASRVTGIELRNFGVNMNFAPVLDVNNNPLNPVINTRSFGSDVKVVSQLGSAYIRGLQRSGCIAVGKHFPGHGDTDKDSHLTLPVIKHGIERLVKTELPPFAKAIESGVEAIMTAHISFPGILNDNIPATVSKKFLTDILRDEMHFNGVIVTDDMEMNAVSRFMDLGEGAVKSIIAGADIILVSTHGKSIETISKAIKKAVDQGIIPVGRLDESVKRIIELKLRYNIIGAGNERPINPKYKYNSDDPDLLKQAEKLNTIVSKEALYLYPDGKIKLDFQTNSEFFKIFITSSRFFKNEIENRFRAVRNKNYSIFTSEKLFIENFSKKTAKDNSRKKNKNTIVYHQFDRAGLKNISEINTLCSVMGFKLCLICTGNPFELASAENLPPVLFSFSNTDESIRQLILCLEGKFLPKDNINVFLGLERK